MDEDRYEQILAAVQALARVEGTSPAVRHICQLLVAALGVDRAVLYLTGGSFLAEPVYATDRAGGDLAETQAVLGEGPAVDSLTMRRMVMADDLSVHENLARWPVFAPLAVAGGAHAVTDFPLVTDVAPVGVLAVHRSRPGALTSAQQRDGRLFARVVLGLLLERAGSGTEDLGGDLFDGDLFDDGLVADGPGTDGLQARWARVHQATGIVAAQLGSGMVEAGLRLGATAFVEDRRLADVAAEVIAGRRRYHPDHV